jgi:hypothetical protein
MTRGRGRGKGAFFLPNVMVEDNMVQAGTSAIVIRADEDTGYRPQHRVRRQPATKILR